MQIINGAARPRSWLRAISGLLVLCFQLSAHAGVSIEHKNLDQLYQEAKAEGGALVVYAGGDTPGQQDGIKKAFEERFPGVILDVVVDYSKFHDARIDNQLATKMLTPDVVQLQTLQNYPRWKSEGVLLSYKPLGWDKVYPSFRDKDGAWTGVFVDAFSNVVNTQQIPQAAWPREAKDYLRPDLKGKIVVTYPTDDDAVLFWFKLMVDKFGWSYVERFRDQQPRYVRGTQAPADDVESGLSSATFSTDGALNPDPAAHSRFVLPKQDPFVSWAQRAAILKDAKHPAAAKLYLSWLLDKKTQSEVWYMWSVRTDVTPPKGYKQIWDYPNTDPTAFEHFMADRAAVERFRAQIGLYLGEVKGEPSPGLPGLHPTTALPH
ncbi:ABC transporter substrate-binding protein [Pseudomonas sp. BF-R-01]|jgi:ABC-type Fe3+ transport system substrate-binding protein|uniref:ABC transporter substrate-binding protein n=1 Tax=Pseudomonas sp. BF-R-01 TaxID=2832365 RepID=UPI001CBB3DCE|nr:extracellular solute-binding protein [Pseudomonas sp. BF-R-01]